MASLAPRVFVSHSHKDDEFTTRLVNDLKAAGADVWVDVVGIDSGDFLERINAALASREWLVLVLTPHAVQSAWVRKEVNAALNLVELGHMRQVIPILAKTVNQREIPPLWTTLYRYDATRDYQGAVAGLLRALGLVTPARQPAPPLTPLPQSSISPDPFPQQLASLGYQAGMLGGGEVFPDEEEFRWPPTVSAHPAFPPDRFPSRLASLGYQAKIIHGVEVILPPLCDVPAGAFLMGSDPARDKLAEYREKPQHWVTLPDYAIARFPVTVAEYACFVRSGHAEPKSQNNQLTWQQQCERPDHPVVNVSWTDAVTYAAWLAKQTGQPWRLPSEAEWEKAARWDLVTRMSRVYPWGDSFDKTRCNTSEGGKKATTPVGSFPSGASPYGAQDMTGNVWEWTSSLLKPYPYTLSDGREASYSNENSIDSRALRGGSWLRDAGYARAAFRVGNLPVLAVYYFGFRMVRALPS